MLDEQLEVNRAPSTEEKMLEYEAAAAVLRVAVGLAARLCSRISEIDHLLTGVEDVPEEVGELLFDLEVTAAAFEDAVETAAADLQASADDLTD